MTTVPREHYLNFIKPYVGQPMVKILTGIRRCGKSVMMASVTEELLKNGVNRERIIKIDLDDYGMRRLLNTDRLYEFLTEKLNQVPEDEKLYIFIDEIQNTKNWELCITSLVKNPCADIYLTGSNSKLLSSELSTHITGRYVNIRMQTLTFEEYLKFSDSIGKTMSVSEHYARFRRIGGFPIVNITDYETNSSDIIVRDILDSIINNDILVRGGIRRPQLLNTLLTFLFDNVGNPYSVTSLSKNLAKYGYKADEETISSYIQLMCDAFLLIPVKGYNLRGSTVMGNAKKYYVTDVSLIYSCMGFKESMLSGIEENLVANGLMALGYDIYIGQTPSGKEIDFVAERNGDKVYVQVTHSMDKDEVRKREIAPFGEVRDFYHRYIVVGDGTEQYSENGIRVIPIEEFLLLKRL